MDVPVVVRAQRRRVALRTGHPRAIRLSRSPAIARHRQSPRTPGRSGHAARLVAGSQRIAVGIDTGQLVKKLRGQRASPKAHRRARWVVARFGRLERTLRALLRSGHALQRVFGARALGAVTSLLGRIRRRRVPGWHAMLPKPPRHSCLTTSRPDDVAAILFPTCMSRIMGTPVGADRSQQEVLLELANAAGVRLWASTKLKGLCCGLPMGSKGFGEAAAEMLAKTVATLYELSDGGALPVVVDASSCTYALRHADEHLA